MTQVQSSLPVVAPSRCESVPGEAARVRSPWPWVAALAAAAVLCWLPFLGRTPSPDEGGLLTVAGQWAPGSSLYGDYWVDRPPLLIGLFALADGLGGALALRVMGLVAVVLTVVLAGVVGRLAAGRQATTRAVVLPAGTAALLLATPLFGSTVVSAELLGLPFVLAGIAAALVSLGRADRTSSTWWAIAAGVAGAAAFLIKQNIVDVAVFVAVVAACRVAAAPARAAAACGSWAVRPSVRWR